TLVSTIADGAVLIDNEMQVILVNPTAKTIFGWEETEVVGNSVLDYLPVQMQIEINRYLHKMTAGDLERAEFRITINEPIKRTIRILLTTVINQQRESIKGIAITIQDITREVELNEAKSQFISNVSHELRTPLFNIKSFIETLHEFGEDLDVEQRQEFLLTVNNETDRLARLVNDVLDLSKLESGRSYSMDGVDLSQAIEQTLRTYQLNARDKGIELIQDIDPNLPLVRGHYDLLLQVLANLIGNALKFSKAGGKVALRAYELQPQPLLNSSTSISRVRVEIGDTGIGIPQEDQQAIFDRFFRVENRVHTLEGTGLGLSIVRNILEDKHHAKVFLVSEVGIGTTFWFDLEIFEETVNSEQLAVSSEQ
ncbi:MAG: ATP-binding protein, partial [Rivularia sp. (in: cyanobacteria)]